MQIRETIDNPSTASTESPPEDVIVLVDRRGRRRSEADET